MGGQNSVRNSTIILGKPCLFNFHAEYIIRNAGAQEAQAGIKIARRNINKKICRYAYDMHIKNIYAGDTTLMAESEEELKSFLMKVKWRVK